jgi:beta-phosphoglucomutase
VEGYACIFDLDGVIVDTAKYHFLAWRKLANALGFDFTEHQNESLKGISRAESLDIILAWGKVELTLAEKQEWLQTKNNWYLEHVLTMNEEAILPGAKEFITIVKNAGFKIALGSASKNAVSILEKVGLLNQFDAIIDGTKTTKSKPDPQVFTMCADELGIAYKNCVVFEDAEAGIEAALSAGMAAIGIGNKTILNRALFAVNDLSEMTLEKLPFINSNTIPH